MHHKLSIYNINVSDVIKYKKLRNKFQHKIMFVFKGCESYFETYIKKNLYNFMCVRLNSFFDREMKVYYVTKVFKQGINIKTMCPLVLLLLFRNTK
mgnify:CR=1 FL=1